MTAATPHSVAANTAPQIGVRESRRVVGRYQLTRDDVLTGRKLACFARRELKEDQWLA
jgi:hypothetical protein